MLPLPEIFPGTLLEPAPFPLIADFDFKIVSKNCASFVLHCAVIYRHISFYEYRNTVLLFQLQVVIHPAHTTSIIGIYNFNKFQENTIKHQTHFRSNSISQSVLPDKNSKIPHIFKKKSTQIRTPPIWVSNARYFQVERQNEVYFRQR